MRRKRWVCTGFLLFFMLFLTGCIRSGKLDEGKIPCVIELKEVPKEFETLNGDLKKVLRIEVYMINEQTQRSYSVVLNEENGFSQDASLNPGFYQVRYCYASPSYFGINVDSIQESLVVGAEGNNYLGLTITNLTEMSKYFDWMQPSKEILAADQFSRLAQWKGELISLKDIANYVEFTCDRQVKPYEQITLHNPDEQVWIAVLNGTEQELPWQECALMTVTVKGSQMIFGKGAAVGQPLSGIVHKEDGVYGMPDAFEGTVFFGADLDRTEAVYRNESSGDKITIVSDPKGEYIISMTYEFAIFE